MNGTATPSKKEPVSAGMKREGGYADRVQLTYANTLEFVSHTVIILLAVGYVLYMTGLLPLEVPVSAIASHWHLSAAQMRETLHQPTGWSVFANPAGLLHGDVISYISVIFLALATLICLASAVMVYIGEKMPVYLTISIAQVLVLLVAASGIMTGAH